ncbi:MAG: ATP-binding protein [Alphaproteobacteria bacterium]|nr:ATP-binding protein [Alphaproteobacteria bacterium]
MIVAVASGKGGTGKTTVAVNLALVAKRSSCLLDCDVEAPNAHLFLACEDTGCERDVSIAVPVIDKALCNGCAQCAEACEFNALVSFGTVPVFAPELCHGCGVCARVCPQKAIDETPKPIGTVKTSVCGNVELVQGRLDIGIALAPPLIRAVRDEANGDFVVIDAPPGTSCSMIAAIRAADYVVLVTEPTPFGLNDLKLAVGAVRALGLPYGVVINRSGATDGYIRPYLEEEKIRLLTEIPDDRRAAQAYAEGKVLIEALPEYEALFSGLLQKIREEA